MAFHPDERLWSLLSRRPSVASAIDVDQPCPRHSEQRIARLVRDIQARVTLKKRPNCVNDIVPDPPRGCNTTLLRFWRGKSLFFLFVCWWLHPKKCMEKQSGAKITKENLHRSASLDERYPLPETSTGQPLQPRSRCAKRSTMKWKSFHHWLVALALTADHWMIATLPVGTEAWASQISGGTPDTPWGGCEKWRGSSSTCPAAIFTSCLRKLLAPFLHASREKHQAIYTQVDAPDSPQEYRQCVAKARRFPSWSAICVAAQPYSGWPW